GHRGGGGGRRLPLPAPRAPGAGGRLRRGLWLLSRLRPRSLLRGARGRAALRGGGRALRASRRRHPHRPGRAPPDGSGSGRSPGRARALRREVASPAAQRRAYAQRALRRPDATRGPAARPMTVRAGSGLSVGGDPVEATLEASLTAMERLGADRADLAVVFTSPSAVPSGHQLLHALPP